MGGGVRPRKGNEVLEGCSGRLVEGGESKVKEVEEG